MVGSLYCINSCRDFLYRGYVSNLVLDGQLLIPYSYKRRIILQKRQVSNLVLDGQLLILYAVGFIPYKLDTFMFQTLFQMVSSLYPCFLILSESKVFLTSKFKEHFLITCFNNQYYFSFLPFFSYNFFLKIVI